MKPLTRNILSAAWMENSFPRRGPRRRETLPATVRSRVSTTNLLTTRCVSQPHLVTFPFGLLLPTTGLCWGLPGCWWPSCWRGLSLSCHSPSWQPVCQIRCPVCAAGSITALWLQNLAAEGGEKNPVQSQNCICDPSLSHSWAA